MAIEPHSAVSHPMQHGVIAAVLRMAEVSAPGTRELVVEFEAASEACRVYVGRVRGPLAATFEGGLSPKALRRLTRICAPGCDPLRLLRRSVRRLRAQGGDIVQFRDFVLRAAKAAGCAERWSAQRIQWLTYPQRVAIEEIRRAVQEADLMAQR